MNRRGAALLLVLWLLALLTSLVAVSMGGVRVGTTAGRNRIELLRAGWAREACLEILLGKGQRWTDSLNRALLSLDSVDLGGGIWCRAESSDPSEYLNLNIAGREALVALIRDSSLVDTLIVRRPWPATQAVPAVLGLVGKSEPAWLSRLTIRGTGKINLNTAPVEVLQTLPGIDLDAARSLAFGRGTRPPYRTLDEALRTLPPATQQQAQARLQGFAATATVTSEQLVLLLSGRVRDGPLVSRATVTLVSTGSRLAVIRRETE